MSALEKSVFFERIAEQGLALTFDDVRLRTRSNPYEPLPKVIGLESQFSRNVDLKIPFVSAAMDTVTDAKMAIAMAKLGGLGVIHSGFTVEEQKDQVRRVKYHMSGLISNPVTVTMGRTLESVLNECNDRELDFRTFPVIDAERRLIGVLTQKGFEYSETLGRRVGRVMTPLEEIVKAPTATSLKQAYKIMQKHEINTLPLVDERTGALTGLYVWSDVKRLVRDDGAQHNLDDQGRLRVAAAVSTDEEGLERVREMAGYIDAVVLDSADGDSYYAFKTLEQIKEAFPKMDVVVGNISDGESAPELVDRGADAVKVGQGPGSICTTRAETGIGKPQVTAVFEAAHALRETDVPVIADGGITNHGDISIAIAAGAHSVMMGRMLAGTDEAPGRVITQKSGARVKEYNGMGSPRAMRKNRSSRKRYDVQGGGEPLAEGIESYVPYKGSVVDIVDMCAKALRKSMRYVKVGDIKTHRQETRFFQITNAGLRESHPHDVDVISH